MLGIRSGIEVQYGKHLQSITDEKSKVVVRFENGINVEGDLLVRCDGAKSTVRAHLLSPEENILDPVPLINAHIAVQYTRAQALFIRNAYHPSCAVAPHPDQNTSAVIVMADVEDPDKPETWLFLCNFAIWGTQGQPASNADRLSLVKSYAANYCEPFRSAAMWIPDDTWVLPDNFKVWTNPVPWDNHGGRIAIAGDAAHPIPPFHGQGLNQALEDAYHYTEAINSYIKGERSLEEAVAGYDTDTLNRGKK